jgi:O-6-methylguanine DNA methyltransferase
MKLLTTWGAIRLEFENHHVTRCSLPTLQKEPRIVFAFGASSEFQTLEDLIRKFSTIKIQTGTKFQRAVWNELRKIPMGETRTYGDIAKAIDRPGAVRAVGTACGANPIALFIPCHRVVAKNGLGGFGSGLPWKKLLLKKESEFSTEESKKH